MATLATELKSLTQAEVDKYIRRDNRLKLLNKTHELQRQDLKQRLQDGVKCPAEGPFLLQVGEQERMVTGFWERECLLLLQEMYGEGQGLEKHADRKTNAPRETCYLLKIVRNLKYQLSR